MVGIPGDVSSEQAVGVLAVGSKSFAFAGRFLAPDQRADAALLYYFCRVVDDLADDAPDADTGKRDLDQIASELNGAAPPGPLVAQQLRLFERRDIQAAVALELVRAVRTDLQADAQGAPRVRVEDHSALLRYCYGVASTVGLMMCGVLGVRSAEALPFAVDLGVAMQLTNICRDVAEDAGMGRIYLPVASLRARGVPDEPQALYEHRAEVGALVGELLEEADRFYASAENGMRFIPWRARLAILVASRVYRAIGLRLRANGLDPMAGRTVVPTWAKVPWILAGVMAFLRSPFARAPHDPALHHALAGLPGCDPAAVPQGA